jgi:hypothetical protein
MTVSSISPLMQASALGSVQANPGVTPAANADAQDDPACVSSVSPMAKLLSQLQQTDPAKLKSALTSIANELQAAAQQEGGSRGQALSNLASKFQEAAQKGDLSALRPSHPHHHGHHHGAAASYQQASDQSPAATAHGTSLSDSFATDPPLQVLDIMGGVLNQNLGAAGSTAG